MNFDFDIRDVVIINELSIKGTVKSINVTLEGVKYLVRYFYNGVAYETYLWNDELTAASTAPTGAK